MAIRNGHEMWMEMDRRHREKVQRKYEKIEMLRALLEMHESNPDHDHEYVVGLKGRLRTAVANLEAMSGGDPGPRARHRPYGPGVE